MSFTKEKRISLKQYLLEKIFSEDCSPAQKAAEAFDISLNTVYRYLRELEQQGIIKKNKKTEYSLISSTESFVLSRAKGELLDEYKINEDKIEKYTEKLPGNVTSIWDYAFTEMMNNAIDHSQADYVTCSIMQNYMNTTILIKDDGIGIFKNIRDNFSFGTLDDAVEELFKGKLTTNSAKHSGEGIFFTSRLMDEFAAISDGKVFTHTKFEDLIQSIEEIDMLKEWQDLEGTVIFMRLSNFTRKSTKQIFDMFADVDDGFTKTTIPVKSIFERYPVSRSQAKRLYRRLENFKTVVLDFEGIDEIGQGFAHELFVVFQNEHPEVELIPLNMSEYVKKMVDHVKR